MKAAPRVDLAYRVLPATPVGPLLLVASERGLREVRFGGDAAPRGTMHGEGEPSPAAEAHLDQAERALALALDMDGARGSDVMLPTLDLSGHTAFRQAVWNELLRIPRGEVRSYGDVARAVEVSLGRGRGSPRAVGQAVGANPLPILVPCHRVVASGGQLGGFSGGLERKVQLLGLEGFRVSSPHFAARLDAPIV